MYFVLPRVDGKCILARFENDRLDPNLPIHEQLKNASSLDLMPFTEALELGSGLIMGSVTASKAYAQGVRELAVREAAQAAADKPWNEEELAKIAAQLEGLCLDPSMPFEAVQEHLAHFDADEDSTYFDDALA